MLPERISISGWFQWVYYQSEEAYKRLVEQHVEKAIIIAIQLSLKHETDMEMTIEEALITLSEYMYSFRGSFKDLNYFTLRFSGIFERLISTDFQRFVPCADKSFEKSVSRCELAGCLRVSEWDLQKYYDFRAAYSPVEHLLEKFEYISPYGFIPEVLETEKAEKEDLSISLRMAFLNLSDRERFIVFYRIGMGDSVKTLKELSSFFQVSIERIRQKEKEAIRKMETKMRQAKQKIYTNAEIGQINRNYMKTIEEIRKEGSNNLK